LKWNKIWINKANYFFINKDFKYSSTYASFVSVIELFTLNNAGLATEFDEFVIKDTFQEASNLLDSLRHLTAKEIQTKYGIDSKKLDKVERAINDVNNNNKIIKIVKIDYRPFDIKHTLYTGISNGVMGRPRDGIMKHMLHKNIALLACRQQRVSYFQHTFISKFISERCSVSLQTGEVNYVFPLYLYPEISTQQTIDGKQEREPNLNKEIVKLIADKLGLTFTNEKEKTKDTFAPIDIFDFIYAVLHSPIYREKVTTQAQRQD
jgi:predicted helicase